jgi:hypothetical protein
MVNMFNNARNDCARILKNLPDTMQDLNICNDAISMPDVLVAVGLPLGIRSVNWEPKVRSEGYI